MLDVWVSNEKYKLTCGGNDREIGTRGKEVNGGGGKSWQGLEFSNVEPRKMRESRVEKQGGP